MPIQPVLWEKPRLFQTNRCFSGKQVAWIVVWVFAFVSFIAIHHIDMTKSWLRPLLPMPIFRTRNYRPFTTHQRGVTELANKNCISRAQSGFICRGREAVSARAKEISQDNAASSSYTRDKTYAIATMREGHSEPVTLLVRKCPLRCNATHNFLPASIILRYSSGV